MKRSNTMISLAMPELAAAVFARRQVQLADTLSLVKAMAEKMGLQVPMWAVEARGWSENGQGRQLVEDQSKPWEGLIVN